FVDLGARQHVEIDIDIFRPAAPQMRCLVEAEVAAVIDRRQALVGALRIMDAVIAAAARHQWRDHHFRSHCKWLAHEIFGELGADLDQHAADLVTERERPRQWLRPMSFQNMQIGAANPAGADLDQRRFAWNLRPRHGADDGLRARAVIGANPDLFHEVSLRPFGICFTVGGSGFLSDANADANRFTEAVIASKAKQSIAPQTEKWIASSRCSSQ